MPAPDDMPKSAAKTMMAASPVEGSQRPRIRIDVRAPMTIMTLKKPTLSPTAFGTVRPNRLEMCLSVNGHRRSAIWADYVTS